MQVMNREVEVLELGRKIQGQARDQMQKAEREYLLRQQLSAIRKELGEEADEGSEIKGLREKIEKAKMPPEAEKEAVRELGRMEKLSASSPEYSVIRTYLEWMTGLPWNKTTASPIDITKARAILDEDHYDLDKVKDRILEYLSVKKLGEDRGAREGTKIREPILCFVGPPGVGKTSLGQSIARALDRKFIRLSLGGLHDEAEIRGHRRTYIGAMPGRIIQTIKRVEAKDPVIMLDEVDKIGADWRGDPSRPSWRCSTRNRTRTSATITWTLPSTSRRSCSLPRRTSSRPYRRRSWTAWNCSGSRAIRSSRN